SCGRNYSCGTVNGIRECAGEVHTCGVTFEGTVVCWGDDSAGQSTPPASLTSTGQTGDGTGETTDSEADPFDIDDIPPPPLPPGVPPPEN
ncbi:MAG: RCC1 domain-containing protein, partial [Chloroflexi bacterium]|nr:RCC1 domain-containing protein [Chloroflexota bacterium]